MVVLLPAPFGPRKPKKRPRATRNERSSTAAALLKSLLSPRTTIASPGGAAPARFGVASLMRCGLFCAESDDLPASGMAAAGDAQLRGRAGVPRGAAAARHRA